MAGRRFADLDEAALARLARQGAGEQARDAAEELFGRYRVRVYRWCLRYVRDHDRALDLAQDAMLRAWRALGRYDERVPFGGWLFVIARNRCYSALRPVSLVRDEDAEPEALADRAPDPATRFEEERTLEEALELMREHLDRREQDALYLRCVERLPVEEITRMLGLANASGARGLLQTARRKLRAAIERREQGGRAE
jgi:RNA polymerase sigma-70 factor (ECF subfamily)